MTGLAPWLLGITVGSALTEFLLLRLFLRMGMVLPGHETLLPLYRFVETLGLVALNLAVLAAAGLIALIASTRTWRRLGDALAGLALIGALLTNLGLGLLVAVAPPPWVVLLQGSTTVAAVVGVTVRRGGHAPGRAGLGLIATVELLALWHVLAQGASQLGVPLPGRGISLFLAEGLAVAAALVLPWSFRLRPRQWHLVFGVALGLFFLAVYGARPWMVATISMWTVSFSLFLPGFLYAAALASAGVTLLALRRQRGSPEVAPGLLLVALAGLKLDFSYFALLALAGLLTLSQWPGRESAPAPSPGRSLLLARGS